MFSIITITISFAGALILVFSVQKNPYASQGMGNGKNKHFALIDLILFKIGVWLLVIGFALQIIEKICILIK